jgi:hypothetical protein
LLEAGFLWKYRAIIEALKGEEKEVSIEGNKLIDAEDKIKYWQRFHGQLTGAGVYNGDIIVKH